MSSPCLCGFSSVAPVSSHRPILPKASFLSAAAPEINHVNLLPCTAYVSHVHQNTNFHRNFHDLRVSSLYPPSQLPGTHQHRTQARMGKLSDPSCAKVSCSEEYGHGTIAGRLTTSRGLSAVFLNHLLIKAPADRRNSVRGEQEETGETQTGK